MKFSRTRGFTERPLVKGFDGRGNVKSVACKASALKALNEEQQIVLLNNPTGGTFTLSYDGETTAALAWNATAAAVDTALEAFANIDLNGITVTGPNGGPYVVKFDGGTEAGRSHNLITGNGAALTGGGVGDAHDVVVSRTIPGRAAGGADADGRFIMYEGTILTVDPADTDKVIQFTAQAGEAIIGVLGQRVEFFGTGVDYDRPADAFFHNVVFDSRYILDFATHSAALKTALNTCRFD